MPKISHYINKLVAYYKKQPDLRVRSSYWGNPRVGSFVFRGEGRNMTVVPLYQDYLNRTGVLGEHTYYLSRQERDKVIATSLGASAVDETNLLDFLSAITGPNWINRRTPRVHRIRRMIMRRLAK